MHVHTNHGENSFANVTTHIRMLVCAIETPRVIASVGPIGERVQVGDGHSKSGYRYVDNEDVQNIHENASQDPENENDDQTSAPIAQQFKQRK